MAMSSSATQAVEAQKPDDTANNAAAAPRKRRRRAPATGASEDCFACRKRNVKCDRRRPYCGPCIEMGKECSGYRTTLTWGVGVASRGKLRGLSLPIPKSPTNPSNTQTTTTRETKTQKAAAAANTAVTAASHAPTKLESRASIDFGVRSPTSPTSPNMYSAPQDYQYLSATSPIPIPSPSTPMGFHMPAYGEHVDPFYPHSSKWRRPNFHRGPLQRLQTSLAVPYDENVLSASSASLGTYSDSDFPSPGEYPGTPDDFPFSDSSVPQYHSLMFHDQTPMSSMESFHYHEAPHRSLPIADDISSSISSDQSVQDFAEMHSGHQGMGPPAFPDIFMEGEMSSSINGLPHPVFSYLPTEGMSSHGSGPLFSNESALTTSIPQSLFPVTHLSPRMRYLLDYYDKSICPVIVAFDGPTNPYRMHVMSLAMRSEGLQNAIAALATNNMRQRGGTEGRRVSPQNLRLLPDHAFSQMTTKELRDMHGEPSNEEKHYKANSIALLNMKLADPNGAQDDSILATLLILCLFHVCDSGFTKFKTQLAGVQKLLSLRDRSVQSNFIGWIELFFTWFDVMTSTVNDRETEVQGDSLDMMNLTANLGALEHLAGCEGRLFKLIARLGRLNLLSQNRPVRGSETTPRASPRSQQQKDFYSFNFDDIDGNGWRPAVHAHEPTTPMASPFDDSRSLFWLEWQDIRSRLEQWEIDPPSETSANSYGSTSSLLALSPTQAALLHISESFRYAALLYTERLANPTPPSRAPNFQSLVAQGLFHISQVGITSCVNKFLLWPLFIIGTECVIAEHRAVVRQRCIEIQRESGFFNNLSGLEVLEKVWQEDDEQGAMDAQPQRQDFFGSHHQAFRWRRAMDRVDGEYIMI